MFRLKSDEKNKNSVIQGDVGAFLAFLAFLESGEYFSALSKILNINFGIVLGKTEILNCVQEDHNYNSSNIENSKLYQLILTKIGKEGIQQINDELNHIDEAYDLNSILIEIYSYEPDNSIMAYLDKPDAFFLGKMLCLSDPTQVFSENAEIMSVKRGDSNLEFDLENNSKITLQLVNNKNVSKIFFSKQSRCNLLDHLTEMTDFQKSKIIQIKPLKKLATAKNDVILQDGFYKLLKVGEKKKIDKNIAKKVWDGLKQAFGGNKKDLFKQSFELMAVTKDGKTIHSDNNLYTIHVYDDGKQVIKVEIAISIDHINREVPCTLSDFKDIYIYVMSENKSIHSDNKKKFRACSKSF